MRRLFLSLALCSAGLLLGAQAHAQAPAYVQVGDGVSCGSTPQSSCSVTLGSAVGSGHTVHAWVLGLDLPGSGSTQLGSCSDDKGNSYTVLQSASYGSGAIFQGECIAFNITNGPSVITATKGSGDAWTFSRVVATEVANVTGPADASIITQQTSTVAGANGVSTGNMTTTVNGDFILGVCNCSASAAGTGFTIRDNNINAQGDFSEDLNQSGHGSIAATFATAGTGAAYTAGVALLATNPPVGGATPMRTLTGVGQ